MADRSISINLRARVSGFIAGMREAKGGAQDLSRQMSETGASADRMRQRLEAATRALPKIKIDADSTAAEIKFAQLRSQMESLGDKKIGIDVSAADARTQIREIERELEKLQRSEADIHVRADIGTALAELRAIDAEISNVDGRRAEVKVDADVSGALRGIALVGAALASLPAVTTIGVGAVGLGAAFAAAGAGAGAFAAVAIPGLTRVNEALKETQSSAGGAGGAMKGAAQKAAEAAAAALRLAEAQDRVKDAADKVKDAQRRVQDALRGVSEAKAAAARAADDAAYREVQSAARIADAERSVQDAHRATQRAIEDLTRAREAAQERIEDLALATQRGALSEERAQLSIKRAQADLARVMNDPKASALDKEDAQLRLREAELSLKEIQERNGDLAKERADSDRKGVEGSDEVVAAKERILEAQRAEADAERAVGEARAQAARDAVDGARSVADANQRVADAQRKVADAQQAVIKAQRDAERAAQRLKLEQLQQKAAMEAAAKSAGKSGAASKMAELSKAERELADDLKHFQDVYLDWQRSLQPDVFPVISKGLGLMESTLPKLTPLVKSASSAFSTLEDDLKGALAGPFWNIFLYNVNTQVPGAIIGLGRSFGNIATGVAGVLQAFLPFTPTIVGGVEAASKAFSEWGQRLKESPEFHEFILFVKENAPEVLELAKNLAITLGKIGEAVAPLGVGAFSGLGLLAKLTAGMDPEHIRLIALAILAIKAAQAGLGVAKFFTEIPGKLTVVRDGFDKTKTAVGKFGDSLSGLKDKVGSASTLLGGAVLTGGLLLLEQKLNDNAVAADRFADKIQALAGSDIDSQIKALSDEIKKLQDATGPSLDLGVVNIAPFATDELDKVDALQKRLDDLRHKKELDAIASKTAGNAMSTMGNQAGDAAGKVGGLNSSLDVFNGKTDAARRALELKDAFNEAKKAIEEAGGKLDITSKMTDKQREAVVKARDQFGGYIGKVQEAARAAGDMAVKSGDAAGKADAARDAILRQLPQLGELAGKNKEAKDQVLLLAQAYGISKTDAEKAMKGADGLREVLEKLKSKKVEITAETKAAQLAIDGFVKLNSGRKIPIQVYAKQERAAAAGAIMRYAQGGIARMAAGGQRPQPPGIATKPTVLYGEGSSGHGATEAFIPYEARYRSRAIDLLTQVASDFGLEVFSARASQQVQSLTGAIDATNMQVGTGLTAATGALQGTLGQAGSLTSAITKVGSTAEQLDQSWLSGSQVIGDTITLLGDGVADMSTTVATSVDGLSESVYQLTQTMGSIKDGASAKKSTGSKAGSKPGAVGATATKTMGTFKKAGGFVEGNQPLKKKSGGQVEGTPALTKYTAFSTGQGPVNSSRVSAPQRVASQPVAPVPASSGSGGASGSSGSQPGGGGVHVTIPMANVTVREEADIPKIGREVGFNQLARPF